MAMAVALRRHEIPIANAPAAVASSGIVPPIAANATSAAMTSVSDVESTADNVTKLMIACHDEDEDEVRELLAPPEDFEDLREYRRNTVRWPVRFRFPSRLSFTQTRSRVESG